MKEALLWEKTEDNKAQCFLCHHRCLISPGKMGICEVRQNKDGTLYSLVYGKSICRGAVDPIEKKPLFHFQPGSHSLSIATVGCNFACDFCQNYSSSQMVRDHGRIMGYDYSPEDVVRDAVRSGCKSVSYTYTEPTIYFEYAFDTMQLAHEKGLKNVWVSNSYMTPEAIEMMKDSLDGINVDLKAFKEETYKKVMKANLKGVLESLKLIKKHGIWVEVTTLIIPTINDDAKELADIASFIANELGVDTPWHVSRFHPDYQFHEVGPTPVETIQRAFEIGKSKGLRYVYAGNVPGEESESTFCYNCGERLIDRFGFSVSRNRIKDGKCFNCDAEIDGVDMG